MRKYCILSKDGQKPDQPWQAASENDLDAVQRRLNDLKMAYYTTKNGDTWSKICAALNIEQGHRKLYYAWISKYHGYGSVKHDDIEVPWMKFVDPYSTARPKVITKFQRGVPFPHPHGGEWHCMITSSNADDINGNATAVECLAQIQLIENMKLRTAKIRTLIDDEKDKIQDELRVNCAAQINNVTSKEFERKPRTYVAHVTDVQVQRVSNDQMAKYAEAFLCDSVFMGQTDAFTAAVIKEVSILQNYTAEQLNAFAKLPPPKTYDEAIEREDGPLWEAAVATELAAFDKYDVMEHRVSRADLRNRGIRGRAIPLKLLYDVKKNDDGSYAKHKARCILMGHSGFLVEGIHYQDTYAPSPDNFSNMFVCALALTKGWKRDSFDVSTAYLQSAEEHNECHDIILDYPKGFGGVDESGEKYVGLLKSPVYGHPTAARSWNKTVTCWTEDFFGKNGWTVGTLHSDPCVFVLLSPDNTPSILIVYVDDCYVQGERNEDLEYIRQSFGDKFGIKKVDPRYFLGCLMEIEPQPDGSYTLTITQPDFVEDMLLEFGSYLSTATVNVPFEPGTVLGVNEPDFDPDAAEQAKYKEMGVLTLAGKLLWLSRRGYNMLLFGVTQLCSIMSKPSQKMWTAGLRMLGWLRDNYKLGIRFHSKVTDPPCIFYDSGHGQYFSDSKAHHGNIAVFAGGPVGNESKKHDDLGDSTPLNEYMACYHAARRARWWYQFIQELDNVTAAKGIEPMFAYLIKDPITLYGDNDTATAQAREKRVTPKSRHTRIKYHYTREVIRAKEAQTIRVPTGDNISDAHSKAVSKPVWEFLVGKMSGYEPIFPYRPSL